MDPLISLYLQFGTGVIWLLLLWRHQAWLRSMRILKPLTAMALVSTLAALGMWEASVWRTVLEDRYQAFIGAAVLMVVITGLQYILWPALFVWLNRCLPYRTAGRWTVTVAPYVLGALLLALDRMGDREASRTVLYMAYVFGCGVLAGYAALRMTAAWGQWERPAGVNARTAGLWLASALVLLGVPVVPPMAHWPVTQALHWIGCVLMATGLTYVTNGEMVSRGRFSMPVFVATLITLAALILGGGLTISQRQHKTDALLKMLQEDASKLTELVDARTAQSLEWPVPEYEAGGAVAWKRMPKSFEALMDKLREFLVWDEAAWFSVQKRTSSGDWSQPVWLGGNDAEDVVTPKALQIRIDGTELLHSGGRRAAWTETGFAFDPVLMASAEVRDPAGQPVMRLGAVAPKRYWRAEVLTVPVAILRTVMALLLITWAWTWMATRPPKPAPEGVQSVSKPKDSTSD